MSKDTITVNMNVHDIPIVVEALETANKEIERLNNIINEANKILSNILVVSDWEHKGKYRPVKNTTSQEVYKSVCMLYGILKTPYRSDYGSLQELKGSNKQ